MAKIDSGLGWKVDEQYYIYDAGAHTYESYYKENDGAAIIAIVYKATTNYGYPVMISTVADYADDNNYSPASATVNGVTWYGVRENSRIWEEDITIGGVVRMPNDDIDPYDWSDSEDIRKAIITAIIVQAGVEFIPKLTTTDWVRGYVEGVEAETATRVKANTTNIGTLSGLHTNRKTNLVSAINEQWSTANGDIISGWYTIGEISYNNGQAGSSNHGYNGIIQITRGFRYTNNESYTILFNVSYQHCNFDVTGICNTNAIKDIRIVYDTSAEAKAYIQINGSGSYSNALGIKLTVAGCAGITYSAVTPTPNIIPDENIVILGETALYGNTISDKISTIGTLSDLKTAAKSDLVSAINELHGTVYTFHIDPDESDSYDAVTYHDDAVGMTPASMGATTFNYGSWAAFINKICKPCMLKFDGTVDYYLDPNDYSKKLDGTASDVADLSYPGNAMVEFSLIWWKAWGDGWVSIADYQVDATFVCYSNLDADGNIIPYFYLPIYNGVVYDGKMRSISGIQLKPWSTTAYSNSATYTVGDEVNYNNRMWKCITAVDTAEDFDPEKWEQFAFNGNTSGQEEIAQATGCNTTNKTEWYTDVWCDRVFINGLLILMGKSIDTQSTFGRGIDSGGQSAKEAYITGSLDNKGLFYGSTANGNTAVKVFGIENWWGCEWRRIAGLIGGPNDTYLYKMTSSTADGSTANGYNDNGSGYITTTGRPTTSSWIKTMQLGQHGMLPSVVGIYSTQYYKDHYWTGTDYANVGGASNNGDVCGAFTVSVSIAVGERVWTVGTALSCKPCLIKGV